MNVFINHTDSSSGNRVAKLNIDAHINDFAWSTAPSATPSSNSNTITVSSNTGQSESLAIYMNADADWTSGAKNVYVTQKNSAEGNRVAKYEITIPGATVTRNISTYGDAPPTGSSSIGSISKGGAVAGKYMYAQISIGGKIFTLHFQVVA
jgi:hypothetical protein